MAYNFTLQAVGLVCKAFVTWRCVTATSEEKTGDEGIDGEGREGEKRGKEGRDG